MIEELKPCPFCNGQIHVSDGGSIIGLTCKNCGYEFDYAKHGDWREEWNARPIEDALRAEVARLTDENAKMREALLDIDHGPVGYWNLPEHHAEVIKFFMDKAHAALDGE